MSILGLSGHHHRVMLTASNVCFLQSYLRENVMGEGKCHGGGQLGKLVLTPFKDFKNAKGKNGVLDKHEKCQYHIDAVLTGKAFLLQCDKPSIRIDSVLDSMSQELAASNKLALKSIVECILYCGRQGISFRGHRDDSTASLDCKKGNFLSLVEYDGHSVAYIFRKCAEKCKIHI